MTRLDVVSAVLPCGWKHWTAHWVWKLLQITLNFQTRFTSWRNRIRISCGSVTNTQTPILSRKWEIVCVQVWHFTKTLKFLFIPHWRQELAVIPLLALVHSLFLWRLTSFVPFVKAFEQLFEKQIQSHSATCLHHSAETRLKDWTEKMLRCFKEL